MSTFGWICIVAVAFLSGFAFCSVLVITREQVVRWHRRLLLDALWGLRLSGLRVDPPCWCEVAIDNSMLRGEHSAACKAAREAVAIVEADTE